MFSSLSGAAGRVAERIETKRSRSEAFVNIVLITKKESCQSTATLFSFLSYFISYALLNVTSTIGLRLVSSKR